MMYIIVYLVLGIIYSAYIFYNVIISLLREHESISKSIDKLIGDSKISQWMFVIASIIFLPIFAVFSIIVMIVFRKYRR